MQFWKITINELAFQQFDELFNDFCDATNDDFHYSRHENVLFIKTEREASYVFMRAIQHFHCGGDSDSFPLVHSEVERIANEIQKVAKSLTSLESSNDATCVDWKRRSDEQPFKEKTL